MPADCTHPPDVLPPSTAAAGGRGGRGHGGRVRGRGRGRARRSTGTERDRYGGHGGFGGVGRTDYTPYEVPFHVPEVSLNFPGNSWSNGDEIDVAVLDAPRRLPIERIYFGPEFSIEDRHLQLISARPHIMASLQSLTLGDSDTGNGGHLTEQPVQAFLAAAPNLRVLSLNACNRLTDTTLTKALDSCPLLEMVKLTGHDKGHGGVRGRAIKELKSRKTLGRNLKLLVLLDQDVDDQEVGKMTRTRKGLAVTLGDTGDCDSPLFTWYDGVIADFDI